MPSPWRKHNNAVHHPCRQDCPKRTWDCKISCQEWLAYEARKRNVYDAKLETQRSYDYTSPMARQVAKRRVIDYKQGRNYR